MLLLPAILKFIIALRFPINIIYIYIYIIVYHYHIEYQILECTLLCHTNDNITDIY